MYDRLLLSLLSPLLNFLRRQQFCERLLSENWRLSLESGSRVGWIRLGQEDSLRNSERPSDHLELAVFPLPLSIEIPVVLMMPEHLCIAF